MYENNLNYFGDTPQPCKHPQQPPHHLPSRPLPNPDRGVKIHSAPKGQHSVSIDNPKTGRLHQISVALHSTPLQRCNERITMRRNHPEFVDPDTVQFPDRPHQPGQHQLEERLTVDHTESEPLPRTPNHVYQQPRSLCPPPPPLPEDDHQHPDQSPTQTGHRPAPPASTHQRRQLGLTTLTTQILQEPALPMSFLRDLHSRRPNSGPHYPHKTS